MQSSIKELLVAIRGLSDFIEKYDEIHRQADKIIVLGFLKECADYLEHDLDTSLIPNSISRLQSTILSAGRLGGDTLGAAIVISKVGDISVQFSNQGAQEGAPLIIKNTIEGIKYILSFSVSDQAAL